MAGVKSVERAISLLREVAQHEGGLVELAEATSLPTTTAARLLATLEDLDAVRRSEDGRYEIGPTVAVLATPAGVEPRLRDIAIPYLEELGATLDEAVGLSVVAGEVNVTIAQVDIPRPVQAENWEGSRWPLADGRSGHAVLSTWPPAQIEDFVRRHPSAPRLAERLAEVPASGVWWSVGEYVRGLTSAAVPLLGGTGVALGTIYAYGPSYRFPESARQSVIETVLLDRARRLQGAIHMRTKSDRREAG